VERALELAIEAQASKSPGWGVLRLLIYVVRPA
jgi:hypothetical protein